MNDINVKKLLKEIGKHFNGTLEENQSSLQDLVNILGDIVECLGDAKIQVPTWKYHLQTLVNKMLLTSNSIIHLSYGKNIQSFSNPNLKVDIIDYASLYILTRGLIENYITFCYIYNNNLPEEEKIFRYKLWEASGLITRQNFDNEKGYIDDEKLKTESILINEILEEIKLMPEYSNLDKNQIWKLSNYGLPRKESWAKLLNESNLVTPLFSNLYSLYSGYAHSEYLSILQISQTNMNIKNKKFLDNVSTPLNNVRIVISLTIKYYINNYSEAKTYFDELPHTQKTVINLWGEMYDKYSKKNKNI